MPVEDCVVAIGPTGGTPVGGGFLVDKHHVLTCAHVVNVSVGKDKYSQDIPTQSVHVLFLANTGQGPVAANVQSQDHWRPPVPTGVAAKSDMAILTLEGPVPEGATTGPLRERYPLTGKFFSVTGFPSGWGNGQGQSGFIGQLISGRYELLEGNDKRPFVRSGFSGAPVRSESSVRTGVVGIVGLVVAARAEEQEKTAYMIPTQQLREFLSGLVEVDICNGVVDDFPHIGMVQKQIGLKVLHQTNTPRFDLRIKKVGTTDEIAQLFRAEPQPDYDDSAAGPTDVLQNNSLSMLLVQSPGGAGKSNYLAALFQAAVSKGIVPFVLDAAVAGTSRSDTSAWDLGFVLGTFSIGGGIIDFRRAESAVGLDHIIVLADRLNENPSQATAVLEALKRAVEYEVPGTRIIIADRLRDRLQSIAPLDRATVLPLTIKAMQTNLGYAPGGTNAKLLAMPFFLDMQLRVGKQTNTAQQLTRSEMFRKFFFAHAAITEAVLPVLAAGAFNAYKECDSTVIPETTWARIMKTSGLSDEIQQKVLDGAMLQYKPTATTEEVVEFRHQLLHDFLAGTHLANGGEAFWRAPNFDTATLDTQSFDGIEFAAEQLGANATKFLIEVYDWNWLGVLEAVRNLDAGRHGGESHISPEFKDALYFLNAMRLFDCFEDSRKRTRSIIADVRTTTGVDLNSVGNFKELRKMLDASYAPKEDYFKRWKAFFLRDETPPISINDLEVLWSDPFMSWTATRIFRQLPLDGAVPAFLQMMYGSVKNLGGDRPEAVGARWRFVHLLGVVKDPATSEFLWSVTLSSDEDKNVRAGAVRSYIENATLIGSREGRQTMFGRIADWIAKTKDIPGSISRQLRTSARLASDNARDYWDVDYLRVIEAGIQHATDERDLEEKDAWQRRKDEIVTPISKVKN